MQISIARERYLRWLNAVRDLSPHTVRAYSGDLAAFEHHLGPATSVEAIDRRQLLAFIERQREAGLSATSIKRRASALRGFCRWLKASELLIDELALDFAIATARGRQLPRVVPPFELRRLLVHLRQEVGLVKESNEDAILRNPHHATTLLAVALMLTTGVRVQEVVAIRVSDIDIWSRSLRLLGKGRREREVYLADRWLTGLTQSYLAVRDRLAIKHERLLFNRQLSPLTAPAMRNRLAKAAEAAGLQCRVTPHMLRHSAATQLIEAGVDIRYIQRLLGHASLSTTEIYTHVSNAALRRVVSEADVLRRLDASDN